ncbi:MAG: ECF RNA polymerase sigma factor EcfG [Haliscomenobacter sp.]|nr:ECF RNA polymerase sigma factor EcfG [Haliscomenobacter sp.]
MSTLEFTTLFGRQQVVLFNFALNLTKDEDSARDLVQETAYKAFKYKDHYQPHTNLRAWLMTIMRNAFINDYRKRRRRQTLTDATPNNFLIDSGAELARNLGETAITMQEIQKAINDLDDWARIPFLLHCEGFKYEEIARDLHIPLGTVKSRIFFARHKLQEVLKDRFNACHYSEMLD